ncbi:MAG: phosphopentomutase [Ruminococcaceae bacterium]|nr:phosphopentomutase [Oscillospiraceae bacterium]
MFKKVLVIVLDSVGIGALPNAADYGDEGAATLQHILQRMPNLRIPNMTKLGLKHIIGKTDTVPLGVYCKADELSAGKDSIVGHWELMGEVTEKPFSTFENGFPAEIIGQFEALIGRKVIGNEVASGTEIIQRLGDEHVKTGYPIVYTSADSVFQIAAHEDVVPLETLYHWCHLAREMFDNGTTAIGRVIARPFVGSSGSYTRTSNRHDYAAMPVKKTVPEILTQHGISVIGVGKTYDIFSGSGFSETNPTTGNADGIAKTIRFAREKDGFIFVNLIDYDMLYGHRRDLFGYASALEEFDKAIPEIMDALGDGLLIITADHGCDPTYTGTDHTREYIPILLWHKNIVPGDAGIRKTFADVGATVLNAFGIEASIGESII